MIENKEGCMKAIIDELGFYEKEIKELENQLEILLLKIIVDSLRFEVLGLKTFPRITQRKIHKNQSKVLLRPLFKKYIP